jgi:hypothetical protein
MAAPVTSVKVVVNGVPLGTAPPLNISWNTAKVPNGVYFIEADGFNSTGGFVA